MGWSKKILILLAMILFFQSGSVTYFLRKDPVRRVTLSAGNGYDFSVNLTRVEMVKRIKYDMHPQSGESYHLAVFQDGTLKPSKSADTERLEMVYGTTLRIKSLWKKDSGTLKIFVTYQNLTTEEFLYELEILGNRQRIYLVFVPCVGCFLYFLYRFYKFCNRNRSIPRQSDKADVPAKPRERTTSEPNPEGMRRRINDYSSLPRYLQTSKEDQVGENEDSTFLLTRYYSDNSYWLSKERSRKASDVSPRAFRRRISSS